MAPADNRSSLQALICFALIILSHLLALSISLSADISTADNLFFISAMEDSIQALSCIDGMDCVSTIRMEELS
jgi:hypothetical protein